MGQMPPLIPHDIDQQTASAVDAYVRCAQHALRELAAPCLEKVVLFGSRARGTHTPDSDADVALVLRGRDVKRSRLILWDMGDLTYETEAEFSFVVSPIILWSDFLERPSLSRNPDFYRAVLQDGIEWPLPDG